MEHALAVTLTLCVSLHFWCLYQASGMGVDRAGSISLAPEARESRKTLVHRLSLGLVPGVWQAERPSGYGLTKPLIPALCRPQRRVLFGPDQSTCVRWEIARCQWKPGLWMY